MLNIQLVKTNQYPSITLHHDQRTFVSTNQRIITALDDENCTGYNIDFDNVIVGFILVKRFDNEKVFLWNMLIGSEYQKRGIGKSSLCCLVDLLISEGIKTVTTTCSINNLVAIDFFDNFGFSHFETIKHGDVHEVNMIKYL